MHFAVALAGNLLVSTPISSQSHDTSTRPNPTGLNTSKEKFVKGIEEVMAW